MCSTCDPGGSVLHSYSQGFLLAHQHHQLLAAGEASNRPILSFDLGQLLDPQRFSALEQSFAEVVELNDAFRQLSADALT